MLSDPAYAHVSFATLARKANIALQELQEIYTNGMRHIGLLKMATSLPDIMGDVAEDAKTTMEVCPRCDGFKIVPAPDNQTRDCPLCKGKGEIRRTGDKHARDLVFESAKLIKQSGPMFAIQQNFGQMDTRMESMLKKTRQIVLEPKKPILTGSEGEE